MQQENCDYQLVKFLSVVYENAKELNNIFLLTIMTNIKEKPPIRLFQKQKQAWDYLHDDTHTEIAYGG